MTLRTAIKASFSGGIAFLFACPMLAAVPVLVELAQHVAEVQIGMYDSIAMAKATEFHPLRMGFGVVKVAALLMTNYWVARWLARRDRSFAARIEQPAAGLFAGAFAFLIAMSMAQLFLLPTDNLWIFAAGFFGGQIIGILIAAWVAGAALGNGGLGPLASLRIMAPALPFTFILFWATMLPLMVPHYALGALALLGPKSLLWPGLIVDSLLVGWLSAVMAASGYVAAARAAERAGVSLDPAQATPPPAPPTPQPAVP